MLEKNWSISGAGAKGHTWEWFTHKFNLANVHVHNRNTAGSLWIYEINFSGKTYKSKGGFDTKEEAHRHGLKLYRRLLTEEIDHVSEAIDE